MNVTVDHKKTPRMDIWTRTEKLHLWLNSLERTVVGKNERLNANVIVISTDCWIFNKKIVYSEFIFDSVSKKYRVVT